MSIGHYLVLSGVLFTIGTAGVFLRRNLITLLLSVEIMLNAVNLRSSPSAASFTVDGQIITFFVMTVGRRRSGGRPGARDRAVPAPRVAQPRSLYVLRSGDDACADLALIPLLPFAGFLVNATSGRRLPEGRVGRPRLRGDGDPFVISVMQVLALGRHAAREPPDQPDALHLDHAGDFSLDLALPLDALSAVMILVVTGIGSLIHIYSTAYMHEETGPRIRALLLVLNLFALLHADARARLERPGDVRRLGGRRPLLVSADRLLLREAVGLRRRRRRPSSSTASATSRSSSACCCWS